MTQNDDYTPPDPYAKQLRAAAERTDADSWEDRWKEQRTRELEQFHFDLLMEDAVERERAPRLTTAELAPYEPPNPYDAGIKAAQAKEA